MTKIIVTNHFLLKEEFKNPLCVTVFPAAEGMAVLNMDLTTANSYTAHPSPTVEVVTAEGRFTILFAKGVSVVLD